MTDKRGERQRDLESPRALEEAGVTRLRKAEEKPRPPRRKTGRR